MDMVLVSTLDIITALALGTVLIIFTLTVCNLNLGYWKFIPM